MARNGGQTAHPKHRPLTEAEARKRLEDARHFEQRARTQRARNGWKRIVRKRERQLREAILRKKARQKPHVVEHKKRDGGLRLTIEGGHPEDRLLYACRTAHREGRLHYLEGGTYHNGYALTNVPHDSWRSDCSWWFLELYRICGLPDPVKGDSTRFTGSILDYGVECSRHYAENHVGCAVVFGSGSGFHVGMSTGKGATIWQHGTPSFRKGTFDEFGTGVEVRYRKFALA